MTTYLGKSCSFCLPRVPFVNCRQFMYLVISLLVLRAGYGIWLYQFLIIAYLFTLDAAYHHVSWLCLQQVVNVLSFAGRDRGLGELWNTWMVGVFVAFIRVVYGRMIYMSLPRYTSQGNFHQRDRQTERCYDLSSFVFCYGWISPHMDMNFHV